MIARTTGEVALGTISVLVNGRGRFRFGSSTERSSTVPCKGRQSRSGLSVRRDESGDGRPPTTGPILAAGPSSISRCLGPTHVSTRFIIYRETATFTPCSERGPCRERQPMMKRALLLAVCTAALATSAHATEDFCVIVQKTPDGFLALREGPGTRFRMKA